MIMATTISSHEFDNERLELERFRKGLCPHCGVKCYEILGNGERRALTVEDSVDGGRCIACQGPAAREPGLEPCFEEEGDEFDDDCENPEAFVEEPSQASGEEEDKFDDCLSRAGSVSRSVRSNGSGVYSYKGGSASGRLSFKTAKMSDTHSMISDDDFGSFASLSQNATVTKCMKELTRQPPIQEKRCFQVLSYLYNITHNDKEKVASAMVLGGAAAVTCAMTSHRSSVRVQSKACSLLGCFASNSEEYQELIYNAGGIPNIIACMISFLRGHKLLQQEATFAVHKLTALPRNADQFSMSQGTKILRNVMQSYASDQFIQEHGCGILYHVALCCVETVANPELIEMIVGTLGRHKKAKKVHANACAVFRVLAENGSQKTRNSMVWADVVPQIIKGMKYNMSLDVVVIEGCKALCALSAERREACVGVAEDGLGVIFDAMKKHEENKQVQSVACYLLLIVSDGPTISFLTKALKKYPGKKILEATKRRFPTDCGKTAEQILTRCQ